MGKSETRGATQCEDNLRMLTFVHVTMQCVHDLANSTQHCCLLALLLFMTLDGFYWSLPACFPSLETPYLSSSHPFLVREVSRTQPQHWFLFKRWHLFLGNIYSTKPQDFDTMNSPRWWPVSRGQIFVEKSYPLVSILDIDGEWDFMPASAIYRWTV